MNPSQLTSIQYATLRCLAQSKSGRWGYHSPTNGWSYGSPSQTERILQALVRKGYARADGRMYFVTDAGRERAGYPAAVATLEPVRTEHGTTKFEAPARDELVSMLSAIVSEADCAVAMYDRGDRLTARGRASLGALLPRAHAMLAQEGR